VDPQSLSERGSKREIPSPLGTESQAVSLQSVNYTDQTETQGYLARSNFS